jgi:hypothetical protein
MKTRFLFLSRLTLLSCVVAVAMYGLVGAQAPPAPGQVAPEKSDPSKPKPDFSGRWRMAKDQCDFGGFAAPDQIIRQVDHHDPTLNVHTVQTKGSTTTSADVSYFTDGSETTNVISGRDATSKAYWDGAALVVRTKTKDSKGTDVIIEDRWELSDDKQTLTNASHIVTSAGGEVSMKLVCRKESK